jgi:hypothetical protein
MTSLLEVAAKIAADKEQASQLTGILAAAKDQAEETAGRLDAIGVERSAARMQQVATTLEEAESLRAALEGGLQKAHWQVMSAVHGRIGPGAPGSGAIVPLVRKEGQDGALAGGLDAVPPHVRHGSNPSGDELTGIDPSLSPFQKEHEGANDDRKLNPFHRGTRRALQNSGDLKDAADQLALPGIREAGDLWKPPEAYPVVGTAEPTATFMAPPPAHADYQGAVGNLVVVAALVAEWAARGLKNRNRTRGKS